MTGTEVWDSIKTRLLDKMGSDTYYQWIDELQFSSSTERGVELMTSSAVRAEYVREYYYKPILREWQSQKPDVARIEIVIKKVSAQPPKGATTAAPVTSAVTGKVIDVPGLSGAQGELAGQPLNPAYTFDQFVVGEPNEMAFQAARFVSASEYSVQYNPLFLYGKSGLGKTHLMHAIGHETKRLFPHKKVIYLSADQFMYEFVQALRQKDTIEFKRQCRDVDLFMIDDIQFFASRTSTREEFLHTINGLMAHNRQIVLSADRVPSQLENVEDFLLTRLSGGLCTEFQPNDFDLRLGILKAKAKSFAERHGVVIPQDILEFLARRLEVSGRDLEGALNKVVYNYTWGNRELTVQMVQERLGDVLQLVERRVTVDEIQKATARHFNISVEELLSKRRHRSVVRPRQIAMYLSKKMTPRSLPDIARRFGGKDHTTVMHAVKRIEELMQSDQAVCTDVEALYGKLRR